MSENIGGDLDEELWRLHEVDGASRVLRAVGALADKYDGIVSRRQLLAESPVEVLRVVVSDLRKLIIDEDFSQDV